MAAMAQVNRKEQQRRDAWDIEHGRAFVGTKEEYEAKCARIRWETAKKVKANCRLCETPFGRTLAERRGYVCRVECQVHWQESTGV